MVLPAMVFVCESPTKLSVTATIILLNALAQIFTSTLSNIMSLKFEVLFPIIESLELSRFKLWV